MERELGRGGMGTVYLARDVRLDRPVALKVLHRELAGQLDSRARFLREARTAARLAHPHIVPIFAVEEHPDCVVIVMAYVDGETLGERLRRRGTLPPDDAERMLRETAWALGYAHAHGVIHRDLTPANILLERGTGRAVLADFGIATRRDDLEQGPVFGTPGYLAPETIRGDPATMASDLYALGAVGYLALAGTPPLEAESPAQLLARHLVQPHRPLAPKARGASRRMIDAVERCLAKDPDARPADTAAFLTLLERPPEPVAIAPALRSWFTRWDRIRSIYALATPLLAMQTWLLIQSAFEEGKRELLTVALITTALSLTAIPIITHLLFEAAELRRLRRVGFGIDDIRSALPHWRAEMVRERRREGLAPLGGRVIWDLTVIGALTLIVSLGVIWPNLETWNVADVSIVRDAMVWMLSGVYFGTLTGVGIGFLLPGHRPKPDGWINAMKEAFWRSRVAGTLARLSAAGQRAVIAASSTLHRNTELVLGLAVDDLWKVIPPATRTELGDVPSLAHALQGSATELRDLIDRLRESERELSTDSFEFTQISEALVPLEARHRETVASLERIRLQLLRLLATREHTAELTQQLEAARLLESALLCEVGGHAELRKLLGRTRRPGAGTPT
ncbi:MAG: serine/threonine-protein kinase [Gemmatimonadota bacterium]